MLVMLGIQRSLRNPLQLHKLRQPTSAFVSLIQFRRACSHAINPIYFYILKNDLDTYIRYTLYINTSTITYIRKLV